MLGKTGDRAFLHMKMQDVGVLYQAFLQYLEGHYMTGEGVMDALKKAIPFSDKLKKSVLLLDGFTGFTPVQMNVIRELLNVCDKVLVTVTMDARENPLQMGKPHQLFYMSRKMIHTLSGLTSNLDDPVLLKDERKGRFGNSTSLDFLEKHLFRYRRSVYEKKQEEICIFAAESPVKELEETARRIRRLVREKNLKYGEIAVITGNLEAYKSIASQVFEESRIPYFLDEKHTILMNPFIEYIRAALEMVTKGFSYESVFRYLRCDMSGLGRDQVDMLENYVLALGIHGYKKWSEKWVRVYRTMDPEDIQVLNEYREIFVREAERACAKGFSSGKRKVCEYCYSLYQFIASCEIQKKLKKQELFFKEKGEKALEKEYAQIYGIVMELLDMVEILGEEDREERDFRPASGNWIEQGKGCSDPAKYRSGTYWRYGENQSEGYPCTVFCRSKQQKYCEEYIWWRNSYGDGQRILCRSGDPACTRSQGADEHRALLSVSEPDQAKRTALFVLLSVSHGQGKALSPAFLVHSIQALYPGLEVKKQICRNSPMERHGASGNQSGMLPERSWRGRCGTGKSFVQRALQLVS